MTEYEMITIAKVVRNDESLTTNQRQHFAKNIASKLWEVDQFFNRKKFMDIATMELPDDFYARGDYGWWNPT